MEAGDWIENKGSQGLWLPKEKGEFIAGEVTEIRQGAYGIQISLKNDKGELVTTPSHKALQNRLNGLQIGDNVKLIFQGTDLPRVKGQHGVNLYQVFVKRVQEEKIN